MPQHNFASEKGNLFVKMVVDFPKTLSAKQKAGTYCSGYHIDEELTY